MTYKKRYIRKQGCPAQAQATAICTMRVPTRGGKVARATTPPNLSRTLTQGHHNHTYIPQPHTTPPHPVPLSHGAVASVPGTHRQRLEGQGGDQSIQTGGRPAAGADRSTRPTPGRIAPSVGRVPADGARATLGAHPRPARLQPALARSARRPPTLDPATKRAGQRQPPASTRRPARCSARADATARAASETSRRAPSKRRRNAHRQA